MVKLQKSSEPVANVITTLLKPLPQNRIKTITPDRSKELSKHGQITEQFKAKFYFPNLHAPWQREACENTNGLIR
ncbi:Transposase [Paucilactobacillus oligofermentans DSM 15707 = LMG 22743]|uniref:IS30 family transposase n=1 Tax=Paucilactobacillus oligofermentans TaxID=293371 RepID=UPI0007098B05|nr:IS30 family transposase [Paucilactobacillus oligofermentans]CUS25984.1 Transposase [Paucilactobacillus oligofermentans DSM 15707 = LMG 22743]